MKDIRCGKKIRKSFSRIDEILEMPNLIEVQKKSYQWFLDEGLRSVFRDVGAITDYTGNLELTFLDYTIDDTTGICDLTIYFDGNARNLEVMISRVSSK